MPSNGGLGIHSTIDLASNIRFGPDVKWIANPSKKKQMRSSDAAAAVEDDPNDLYEFDPTEEPYTDFAVSADKLDVFHREVQRYYPGLRKENLQPDYAGIRPKLIGPYPTTRSASHR